MRSLFDNPALLLVGMVLPLLVAVVGLFVIYWLVRLGVRHGAADADRLQRGGGLTPHAQSGPAGPAGPAAG
ncbi:hypothetical protein FHN55_14745 [Streptomyces sp. NP160]|uniref:hypothetical protein n=1 Tax=Streptomyces sp. NP160 TaxID=2586637 RepID=UPI001118E3D5|nr:hypothetical protein [Streptomyces sp. NP160]TNM64087.1 hypothetical protein FHN55_14745 [Streptomyces sp. NP160]